MTKAFSHERVSDGKDEWLTPPELIKALGVFDLDPCSPIVRPWDTALEHYTIEDDGLMLPWEGRVWLNPPYGRMTTKWMEKMARHNDGIALIFARTETATFTKYVWPVADSVLFLDYRLTFCHVTGKQADNSGGAPSCLIAYGSQNTQALIDSKLTGTIVKPIHTRSRYGAYSDDA